MAVTGVLLAASCCGCAYTTRSSLPGHIRTVEVPVFENNTFYKGLESKLTRAIIEKLNREPRLQVVRSGGNATLRGEILDVRQVVLQKTRQDRPTFVKLVLTVQSTVYDNVEDRELIPMQEVVSSQSSSGVGIYEPEEGEVRTTAEEEAIAEVADIIVRDFVEYWPSP
jgi:hypothetical protein